METTDEVPDWAKLWLDLDVAAWLHREADRDFGGDVELCMNETIRMVMAMTMAPTDDLWAMVDIHKKALARGRLEQLRRAPKPPPAIRLRQEKDGTPPG